MVTNVRYGGPSLWRAGTHSFQHTVAQSFEFLSSSNIFTKFDGVGSAGDKNRRGIKKFSDFRPINRYISQTIRDSAIVSMEGE